MKSSYYKYIVFLPSYVDRQIIKQQLFKEYNISLTGEVYANPCHSQPVFKKHPEKIFNRSDNQFPVTNDVCKNHICLPLYPGLTNQNVQYIVECLKKVLKKLNKINSLQTLGKKYLVTGGAGFIGSHLVDMLLESGAEKIVIFDNFIRGVPRNISKALRNDKVELFRVKGDTTHIDELYEVVDGVDGVFHLAALCLEYCQEFPRSGLNINVVGTFNLLDACVRNGVKRVIYASSSSIYGNAVYSPMDEDHPYENRNFYGATKIAGEALIRAFYFKYDLDYLSYRFMNVYGPRQDYLGAYVAIIIKIIDKLQKDQSPIIFGDGSQGFDFVYVKDACRSMVLGMESNLSNQSYNISSGNQVSILMLCKSIMKLMDKEDIPIEFKEVNEKTLVNNRIGSTEKAKTELGFEVSTSLEEGLMNVIEWKLNQK